MTKRITDNQLLGELGETAVKKIVLEIGFIYEHRGRLEAGTDGLIELRDPAHGTPLGKLLGVQVKSTDHGRYLSETDHGFEYLLRTADLQYWRGSNIPVIIVLWRKSDETAYWKDVTDAVSQDERRLRFDKRTDVFDRSCADRLGALTVDRRTPGVFVPPLNQGEEAIINLMRICLPSEIFVATSPFASGRDAFPELMKQDDVRHDWVIRKRRLISFFDPRSCGARAIVDEDQVEAVETHLLAQSEDVDDINDIIELLRRSVERQLSDELAFLRKEKLFYFRADRVNTSRRYHYFSSANQTSARVVSHYPHKTRADGKGYVRHHAASLRFERLDDEWFVVIDPTFYFTHDGFQPHRYPEALLAGKKKLEKNAAVRGQVIMWQHLLAASSKPDQGLFAAEALEPSLLRFNHLPLLELSRAVPESSWTRTDPRASQLDSSDLAGEGLFG